MSVERRGLRFFRSDPQPVLEEMAALAARGDGSGWLNLHPIVAEEDQPTESLLGRLFSAKGPAVPLATWVPGWVRKGRPVPTQAGLQHPAGTKAAVRLADAGMQHPAGWTLRQDHVKRGVVYEVPDGEDPSVALEFLLLAARQLCDVRFGDRWLAVVFTQN